MVFTRIQLFVELEVVNTIEIWHDADKEGINSIV